MDITAWLRSLGLERFEQAFRDNEINESVLLKLTAEDLKELGVIAVGHRRILLDAIANLGGETAAKHDEMSPVTDEKPDRADRRVVEAERRQLTVMFCDLVGSTALSAKLDPEDLRGIIAAYHRCCTEVVERNAGFVAKYMGDGVLAYFGYPQAHEHDAESAVRAGLALVEAVPKLTTTASVPLQVRVGIATGLVVVGDLIGAGPAQEQAVVGETPNLAARLQELAEPGSVVIASSTRRLIGGLFDYRDLGAVALKGLGEHVPAWLVLGVGAAESRFEALRTTSTPLIGRSEEIELLLRRWGQAKNGDGQVVLIAGEAGIGKSRIAQTVVERLGVEPHTRLRYFCSPHHQDSALYPSITQLERAAGFRREDTPEQRLAKLEAVLAQGTNDLNEAVPLLADLLSIPTVGRYPQLNLTPQKRKEKTLDAQLAQVEGLTTRQPVLMVFEDIHWSDPTTQELLDLLIDRVPALRVMVIITFRPEFAPPWLGRPQVTLLSLNRLPPRQRAEMIMGVTGGKALPTEIANQIIDRTDGVPLFIEELTKSVVESGLLTEAGELYTVRGPLVPLAIPTTLHASLLARLDRLAPIREVAQIGAALGRSFSHELISAAAGMPEQRLDDGLRQLVRAELVFRRGAPPDAEYTFKHALVQDAAYSTLLRGARRQLHARIAKVLEERFPETAVTQPELLAHHCAEGGLIKRAVDYWFSAGERALRACANVEAIKHHSQGIQLLASLPDTRERQRQELRFQTALGPPLMAVKGWAAPEAMRAYDRADELSRFLGDASERFKIVWGLWILHMGRGESCRGRELSDELFRLADQADDDDLRLEAHHSAWGTLTWLGEFATCWEHIQRGLTLYSPVQHAAHAFTYGGHDPGVCGMALAAVNLWFLGYPERAAEHARRSLLLAEEIAHPASVAHALHFGLLCHHLRQDGATARAWGERLAKLAAEQGLAHYATIAVVSRGWILANEGQVNSSLPELRRGRQCSADLGMRVLEPYYTTLLATCHLAAGDAPIALELLEEASRFVEESGIHYWDVELLRLKGKLLAQSSPCGAPQEVEACYAEALAAARRQQARSLELRVAMDLARLWRDQGKRAEARDLLAPIYNWFTEGFDTPVLKEARALLADLA